MIQVRMWMRMRKLTVEGRLVGGLGIAELDEGGSQCRTWRRGRR